MTDSVLFYIWYLFTPVSNIHKFHVDHQSKFNFCSIYSSYFYTYLDPRRYTDVLCSHCKENIVGSQYKCQSCANYSLCEECMSERMHPKHTMSLIRNPRQRRTIDQMERVITFSYDNIILRALLGNWVPYIDRGPTQTPLPNPRDFMGPIFSQTYDPNLSNL